MLIDHTGIAVSDMPQAIKIYTSLLGIAPSHSEKIPERQIELTFFDLGSSSIELLAPLGPNSTLQSFLDKRGSGIHHIAFTVTDIRQELLRLSQQGYELIDSEPRSGARNTLIAFIKPGSCAGALVELVEHQTT